MHVEEDCEKYASISCKRLEGEPAKRWVRDVAQQHARQCDKRSKQLHRDKEECYYSGFYEAYHWALDYHADDLQQALDRQDTDAFWMLFWHLLEGTVASYTAADKKEARALAGRGTNLIKSQMVKPGMASDKRGLPAPAAPDWVDAIRKQANRCCWIANMIAVQQRAGHQAASQMSFNYSLQKACSYLRWQVNHKEEMMYGLEWSKWAATDKPYLVPEALLDLLLDTEASPYRKIFALRKAHKHYLKLFAAHLVRIKADRSQKKSRADLPLAR